MNRRSFVELLAGASISLKATSVPMLKSSLLAEGGLPDTAAAGSAGLPTLLCEGNFTPFGYLDNPWHTWDMHRSGVLRSTPGMGMSLYYPAGPGGYFDFEANNVYEASLNLFFRVNERYIVTPDQFEAANLHASYHTKNMLTYKVGIGSVDILSSVALIDENAIGFDVRLRQTGNGPARLQLLVVHSHQLGGAKWWGRDGLAAGYYPASDSIWTRGFAAGDGFVIKSTQKSSASAASSDYGEINKWFDVTGHDATAMSYYPKAMHAALRYDFELKTDSTAHCQLIMARGANPEAALQNAEAALPRTLASMASKRADDAQFWNRAPGLTGDWPSHWKNGWVYDFETLRMMVRNPIGVYKHPWEGMQIQSPRSVLAEGSIDMWCLSYADPSMAKAVFAGQFLDAIEPNLPCMREDGVMNMVAVDGSACGTSISWCFPFLCAASIFDRDRDLVWMQKVYPGLAALLEWTLQNRTDAGGFVVGKCSWETGMDTSKRFQIHQPTGGELVEFLRLVELQAAASHAAALLARFAQLLPDAAKAVHWRRIQEQYAKKTQELWKDDWFHDFDTQAGRLVVDAARDPSQAAPIFCGIASLQQAEKMLPTLLAMYDDLGKEDYGEKPSSQVALYWSSFVMPYLESAWAAGDRKLTSDTVTTICERIYASMDRRSAHAPAETKDPYRGLGWPGVSCEIWGARGAFGGEGYGWGAVMPAHIIRNLMGFRETESAGEITVAPAFPAAFAAAGKKYGISGLRYLKGRMNLTFNFTDDQHIQAEVEWPAGIHGITDFSGRPIDIERSGYTFRFSAINGERYQVKLSLRTA